MDPSLQQITEISTSYENNNDPESETTNLNQSDPGQITPHMSPLASPLNSSAPAEVLSSTNAVTRAQAALQSPPTRPN